MMSNYFGRKAVRIKNLPNDVGEMLVREINRSLHLDKVAKIGNAVYIYIPTQLTNFVQKKVLEILNNSRKQNSRKYNASDLEIKSTIVVITNIPTGVKDDELDSLLAGFGRTLTKFQFVKWKNSSTSMKLGWVVFEDLQSAEICEEKVSNMRVNNVYLRACILPENIISGQCFQELCTLHIEGFPSHFCNEDKIRDVLAIITPSSLMNLKYLRTNTLQDEQQRKSRYIALLDWNTPEDAYEAFVKLDGFQAADSKGNPLINLIASFALPNTSAFGDYLQSMGRTAYARNVESPDRHGGVEARLSTQYRPVERKDTNPCGAARPLSPPPPYVETEAGLQRHPVSCAPPPYTVQPPGLTSFSPFPPGNNTRLPLLPAFPLPPQTACSLVPPMSALLNPQQLFQTLLLQGHQLTQQQFQQLGMQAAQQLARTTQQNPIQHFQPPPPVTPRQTHILQDGRPVVVQFSNHYPPLKKHTSNPVQTTRQNVVRPTNQQHIHQTRPALSPALSPVTRNHRVCVSQAFVHTADQAIHSPTHQHHAVRRADQKPVYNRNTSFSTGNNQCPTTNTGRIQTAINQSPANDMQGVSRGRPTNALIGNINSNLLTQESRRNTDVATQSTEEEREEKNRESKESPKTDVSKPVTPDGGTPWANKRNARRWSTSKKVNSNYPTKWTSIIDSIVQECESENTKNELKRMKRIADRIESSPYKNKQTDIDKVLPTTSAHIVSGEEKQQAELESHPSEEAPNQKEIESINILDALTRMSILDSMGMQNQTASRKTLSDSYDADDEDSISMDSRLLSFQNCIDASKKGTGAWKPLPREMFNKLF